MQNHEMKNLCMENYQKVPPFDGGKRNQKGEGACEEKAKRIIETKKKEKQNDNLLKRQFFQLRVGKFSRFFQTTAKNVLFDCRSEGGDARVVVWSEWVLLALCRKR